MRRNPAIPTIVFIAVCASASNQHKDTRLLDLPAAAESCISAAIGSKVGDYWALPQSTGVQAQNANNQLTVDSIPVVLKYALQRHACA